MIDHNHPAVEADLLAHYPFITKPELQDYWNAESAACREKSAAGLTAALPLLESATEDNLARLRDTPAGKQLLAEGWEAACRKVIHMAWADSSDAEYLADEGNPYRTETPQ